MTENNSPLFDWKRREFLTRVGMIGAGVALTDLVLQNIDVDTIAQTPPPIASGTVPKRKFGRANIEVSALALGGYHIGMVKTQKGVITPQEALRYAMSLPVTTMVSGIDSLQVLRQNLSVARGFKPMNTEQLQALRDKFAAFAADGRFERYKTPKKYDGASGKEQHGFPPQAQLTT